MINVRLLTNEKTEVVKEEFYNLFGQNINQLARLDIKIILGDFNAKVGKEDIYKPIIGNESLHKETNNGIKMIQFTISKGFNVRSTTFPHKDIHKDTWYSANGRTANQIDHVFISTRFRNAISDNKALREPDNLLKINFKVKETVKTEKKYEKKRGPRWHSG